MDIRTIIGQRLAFGFSGTELTPEFRQLIGEYKIGSVILFRSNIVDKVQLRKLCRDIQDTILESTGQPAFIMIDQEGGMVSRLSPDLVCVPGNMAVAASGDPETAYRMACITARQLRGTGPNFNLAPALDVNSNSANPVIGVRSYGDDPDRVCEFGKAAVRGYRDCGLLCCGKHFPGHGDTAVDSHRGLPLIDKDLRTLQQCELVPFLGAIEEKIPAFMTSHILFPQIEPEKVPATMSRRIIHDILRVDMGFEGLIVSDDMRMDAIRTFYGTSRGCVAAMKAGVDVIVIGSDPAEQQECAEAVLQAAESGELSLAGMEASCGRILAAREKYAFTRFEPDLAGKAEDFDAACKTSCDAVSLYSGTPRPMAPDTFFCGPMDYRMTDAANADRYSSDFAAYMTERFGMPGAPCSVDPTPEEIGRITEEAKKHSAIVLGTCNGHLYRGQLALAKALSETGLPLTVIALRNPYDLSEIYEASVRAAVFDYTHDGLYAAEQFLQSGSAPGRMPVRME